MYEGIREGIRHSQTAYQQTAGLEEHINDFRVVLRSVEQRVDDALSAIKSSDEMIERRGGSLMRGADDVEHTIATVLDSVLDDLAVAPAQSELAGNQISEAADQVDGAEQALSQVERLSSDARTKAEAATSAYKADIPEDEHDAAGNVVALAQRDEEKLNGLVTTSLTANITVNGLRSALSQAESAATAQTQFGDHLSDEAYSIIGIIRDQLGKLRDLGNEALGHREKTDSAQAALASIKSELGSLASAGANLSGDTLATAAGIDETIERAVRRTHGKNA